MLGFVLLLALGEIKHAVSVKVKTFKDAFLLFCLGLSLVKGGGPLFLVLDGMRLCDYLEF